MRALYRIGNNLNQLLHLSHKFGSIHATQLEKLNEQMNDLILLITRQMITPDDLDTSQTLERGRLLADQEQSKEEADYAEESLAGLCEQL